MKSLSSLSIYNNYKKFHSIHSLSMLSFINNNDDCPLSLICDSLVIDCVMWSSSSCLGASLWMDFFFWKQKKTWRWWIDEFQYWTFSLFSFWMIMIMTMIIIIFILMKLMINQMPLVFFMNIIFKLLLWILSILNLKSLTLNVKKKYNQQSSSLLLLIFEW